MGLVTSVTCAGKLLVLCVILMGVHSTISASVGGSEPLREVERSDQDLRDEPKEDVFPDLANAHPTEQDLHDIYTILDFVFNDEYHETRCANYSLARNNARNCLVHLANIMNGISAVNTCPNYQGQYDCINERLTDCEGQRDAMEVFYGRQRWLGDQIGCRINPRITPNIQSRIFFSGPGSFPGFGPTLNLSDDLSQDACDALYVLSAAVSFFAVFIPKALAVAVALLNDFGT